MTFLSSLAVSHCALCALAWHGTGSPQDELLTAYERIPTLVATMEAKAPTGTMHLARYVLAPDGRFAEEHYIEGHASTGSRWREVPAHLSGFDGKTLRVTEAGGAKEYTETAAPELAKKAPGPNQWAAAPATHVATWIMWMKEAGDMKVTAEGGETAAVSEKLGMELRWDAQRRITNFTRRDRRGNEFAFEYSGFAPMVAGFPEMATRRRELIREVKDGETRIVRDVAVEVKIKASEREAEDLTFAGAKFDASRYDTVTGDVVAPNGTVLYNKNKLEAMLDERSVWTRCRPYAMVTGGVIALGGLAFGVRRRMMA